ncbi:hypothetical protein V6Z77_010221 [Aspergillus fumigatus]
MSGDAGAKRSHIWMMKCLRISTDGCRRWPCRHPSRPTLRVRLPCRSRRRRALLRFEQARARRPTKPLWRLPVSAWVFSTWCRPRRAGLALVTSGACERLPAGVCPAQAAPAFMAPACLAGEAPLTVTHSRPARAPAAPTGQPTGRRALACAPPPPPPSRPPRPPPSPPLPLALPALPSSPRARFSAHPEARLPGPQPPQPTLSPGTAEALAAPFPHTHRPSPAHHRARKTFPGPNVVPGEGPPAPADCAPPVRPYAPANWSLSFVTRRRRRAGPRGHLGRPTGESPWRWRSRGGPAVTGAPASPEKGVWAPSQRPALPGPLMGGVCQQI